MNKPTSVKFPKEMLADIDNECEGLGCNRTDFIREAVKEKLDGKVQDQEENSSRPDRNTTPKEEPKPTLEEIPELKKPQIVEVDFNPSDYEIVSEPKPTVKEIPQDNSNKPVVNFVPFNGQILPFAKRYNI